MPGAEQRVRSEEPLPRVAAVIDQGAGLEAWVAVDAEQEEEVLAFGGLRIAPTVDAGLMTALARGMSAKFRMHGVPIRGAKAGIRAEPASACTAGVAGAFARGAGGLLRSQVIVGKDMGATDGFLDACYEALGAPQLHLAAARGIAGCPERVRALRGYRPHMTGLGVAWSADEALRWAGGSARGARVLVQGAGRVGLGSAVRLAELGAVIVGISDRARAVARAEGLPVEALQASVDPGGALAPERLGLAHETLPPDLLLGLEADVLVLAADSRVVDARLAAGVQARVVVEGANFPNTREAEEVLRAQGRVLVPDVLASSSSAALVGHQIVSGNGLDPELVWARIERAIRVTTRAALEAARPGETLREAFFRMQGLLDA